MPVPPTTYPQAGPRPLPSSLIWCRRVLLMLAALQTLAALAVLLGAEGNGSYRSGAAIGTFIWVPLILAAGQRIEQAGPRRFAGIVAIGTLGIVAGLARAGQQDLSGLVTSVLGIAVVALVTQPAARAFLRSDR
jgi:hypothetical protein